MGLGGQRWPSWGYVSYLSDRVVSGLGDGVRGVSLTRFGSGWVMVVDSRDPVVVAGVWVGLRESGCLRFMPPVQDYEPCFPDVSGVG